LHRFWRLVLRIVLSFVVYSITMQITGAVANTLAQLFAKGGAPDLWRILHRHAFGRSVVIGFLAGLIPLEFLISASGYFRSTLPDFFRRLDLENAKKWIVVLVSPVALIALAHWISDWFAMSSKTASVLKGGSPLHFSQLFDGFFSDNCKYVTDMRIGLWGDDFGYQCMVHVLQISIVLVSAAYSLAQWVKRRFPKHVAVAYPKASNGAVADEATQNPMDERDRTQ
jgi:hypothetical protein